MFDFVYQYQLSSTASLSLSELSSTAKFFKISQSVNIDVPIGYLDCEICLSCLFAIVYDDDHINYVVTVLRSKIHIEE